MPERGEARPRGTRPALLLAAGLLTAPVASGCRFGRARGPVADRPTPRVDFRNVARVRGLDFHWGNGGKSPLTNLQTFGCGCAFLDYDGDGHEDIFLVGEPTCALFRNVGGQYSDVSAATGLSPFRGPWKGCAVGDYDGDGWPDLYLTGYRRSLLLRNVHGQRWEDRTQAAHAENTGWGSSAGFMDLDGDGFPELVVGNYVVFGPGQRQYCEIVPGIRTGCPPHIYQGEHARLLRNRGDGTFADASASSGILRTGGKALVVGFADFDDDGRQDFYLGNDGTPADLLHNTGQLHFKNEGVGRGVGLGLAGQAQASMGVDWGDYDRDGRLDLVNTAFSDESYSLYRNFGSYFENMSARVGLAQPTFKPLGFGAKFLDADNDGWLDLVFANGHVYDRVHEVDRDSNYREPMQLFLNERGERLSDFSRSAGLDLQTPIVGRGLAVADFDDDGRQDILVVDYEGSPLLLHNETPPANRHWLELELRGLPPNRFAYGARVTVSAGGARLVRQVSPASSYLSSSSPRLHFGLGTEGAVDGVEVRWPDGRTGRWAGGEADRKIRLEEAASDANNSRPLPR